MKLGLIALTTLLAVFGIYQLVDWYFITSAKPIDPLSSLAAQKTNLTTPPSFTLRDLNGETIEPSLFQDKILIVNFWASWCGPCVEEFPSLLKLIETYKDQVVLLAISADESEAAIHQFLKNYKLDGLPVHVAWDQDRTVAQLYGTSKLPESYIFKKGSFYRKIEGIKNWHSPAFLKTFSDLIQH